LDRDANGVSGECDPSEANPNRTKTGGFCGPENINVDFPPDLSKYAVALKYFAGAEPSRPHVNIYCNGERVFSAGFDPVSGNAFPVMRNAGMDTDGDMWKVALVTIRGVGAMGGIQCDVAPIPSQRPDLSTDGTAAYCIDNAPRHSREATSIFMEGGYTPAEARALCFH
jgi:hypothetical protein